MLAGGAKVLQGLEFPNLGTPTQCLQHPPKTHLCNTMSPMTFPLTTEDVNLIVNALQLISNDEASLLKDRLLLHYSSYFPAHRFEEEVQDRQLPIDQVSSFSICNL